MAQRLLWRQFGQNLVNTAVNGWLSRRNRSPNLCAVERLWGIRCLLACDIETLYRRTTMALGLHALRDGFGRQIFGGPSPLQTPWHDHLAAESERRNDRPGAGQQCWPVAALRPFADAGIIWVADVAKPANTDNHLRQILHSVRQVYRR